MKKRIWIGAGVVFGLFLLAITLLVIFRSKMLTYTIQRVTSKVESRYPVNFSIGNADFVNLRTVVISGISLVPHDRDTLFTTDSVHATVSLRSIFKGRIVFTRLEVANGYLTAIKHGDQDNFSFLMKNSDAAPADTATKTERNYGELLNNLIETAFDNVPDQVDFRNLNVSYKSDNRTIDVRMPFLVIEDGDINTEVAIQIDSLENNLRVNGTIDPGDYHISANLFAADNRGIRMPYVKAKFGGDVTFDTLRLSLTDKTFRKNMLTVKGSAVVNNLLVNHTRLADEAIQVKESAVDYVVTLGPNYYAVDSLTQVRVNKAVANIGATYRNAKSKIIDLNVRTKALPANDFFESLPAGLFENLDGIRANGTMQYEMMLHVDLDNPDSVRFDSDLDASKDFKIVKYGNTNLEKINGSFVHTVYEYGKPVRTFTVGPSNPIFVRIGEVSPYLRNAILTAEDAGYYRHNGFHEEAIRQAIATNIKKRGFVRGGSTLSMQLVKNVYLTRKKNIARKVEEAIIVWLIENLDLVSKNRMFEVYLNIIEWGPDVYGAKDASRFYFGKLPHELTLAESIFLTSIIPSPKRFRSSFDNYGNLRSYKAGYYRLISGNMVRRGLITQEEYETLEPNVRLFGRARDLIVTAPDAENEQEEEEYELKTIDMFN